MMTFFIILQSILLFFMLFHDWIPVPPFNDVKAQKQNGSNFYRTLGSIVNGAAVLIPLSLALYHAKTGMPYATKMTVFWFYLILTIGAILSWWVPYFFGSSQKHKNHFKKFADTHTFLPTRGDNVTPNTLHIVLHLQIWICLAIAIYLLIQ